MGWFRYTALPLLVFLPLGIVLAIRDSWPWWGIVLYFGSVMVVAAIEAKRRIRRDPRF